MLYLRLKQNIMSQWLDTGLEHSEGLLTTILQVTTETPHAHFITLAAQQLANNKFNKIGRLVRACCSDPLVLPPSLHSFCLVSYPPPVVLLLLGCQRRVVRL